MAKKKDCFGSDTYVCRTQNCAYMSECVKVVWEKKLKRILARRPATAATPSLLIQTPGGVRLRAKEFLPAARTT
jgi:hypothetical protein